MTLAARIAVVGDVHLRWSEFDVDYFNASNYDVVLFVGDLAAYRHGRALRTAASIGRLKKPAIVIPGNHDAVHVGQLVAEVMERPDVSDSLAVGQPRRRRQLARALGNVTLGGYSRHPIRVGDRGFSILAARPHSMGGARVSFRKHLHRAFDVRTIEDSTRRLVALVEQCDAEPIIFLGHNGPTGFGNDPADPWGCDFRPQGGDQGDPDLELAIAHAKASGRRVLAVVAGHMHHALKTGGQRRWSERRDQILYLNAARVPRIFRDGGRTWHHHIALELTESGATFSEQLIAD